ncbi:hypothetical protein CL635_02295 [bacterium]|jgi:DNA polymerase-3 subunit delta'|nr:hypothetical protein [bacterium]|tara:strand:+ start:5006 stop:5974 length:969 start_codon:yes stop_codon:yes gene_type:complete
MPKLQKIIGHLSQQEQLRSDLQQDNVSHAYLFSGQRHLGKMSLALQFAFDLLSTDVAEERNEQMQSQFERLTHPDLLVLDQLWMEETCDDWDEIAQTSNVPQIHRSKAPKAKTDIISIDDIRALHERLMDTGSGKYRCCVIRSVERMKDAAANAFLKILEEPPEGLVFLLTTEHQSSLLPTIISRTRVVPFQRTSIKDLKILLEGVPEDDQKFLMHIASGAPGMVVRLRDDPDLLRLHRTVHTTAQTFWRAHSLRERLQILSSLHKRGQESDDLLLHLGMTLREQSAATVCKNAPAFAQLAADLHTNAHRQMLAQRFVLSID